MGNSTIQRAPKSEASNATFVTARSGQGLPQTIRDTLKATQADKLLPSARQMRRALAGKPIPGERFGLVKGIGRKLWANKLSIAGTGLLVGGGVAAAFMHSQWLPQALHLATSPVGIGVLAGVAGLALIAVSAYVGRQLSTNLGHVRANNARIIAADERKGAAPAAPRAAKTPVAATPARVKTTVAKAAAANEAAQAADDSASELTRAPSTPVSAPAQPSKTAPAIADMDEEEWDDAVERSAGSSSSRISLSKYTRAEPLKYHLFG